MEVVQRLQRVDERRPDSEKTAILDVYTDKLLKSGHSVRQARSIVMSGVRHFKRCGPFKPRDMSSKVVRLNKLVKDMTGKEDWS